MKVGISEILEKASQHEKIEDRATVLRQFDNPTLRMLLRMSHDKDLKWALPDTAPPYRPYQGHDAQGMLYAEARRLYLFHEGGNPNLKKTQREQLFITLLECLDPKDAELILAIKEKTLPYKAISTRVINKAFPGLLNGQDD